MVSPDSSLPASGLQRASLGRAFTWVLAARGIGKLLLLGFYALVARNLGVEGFGSFAYHLILAQMFAVFADFGLSTTSVRAAAQIGGDGDRFFGVGLAAKLLFVPPLLVGIPWFGVMTSGTARIDLGVFAASIVILDSFSVYLWGPFRLRNRLEAMAISEVLRALTALALFMALQVGANAGVRKALVAYLAGAAVAAFMPLVILLYRGEMFRPRFRPREILGILRPSVFVSLAAAVYVAGFRGGVLLLDHLRGPEEVGLYNSAYTFFTNLASIPMLASTVIFPSLALLGTADRKSTRELLRGALGPLMTIGVPLVICGPLFATALVRLVYGETYGSAGAVLAILLPASGLYFLSRMLWSLLIAIDRHVLNFGITTIAVGVNGVLCVLLIPSRGGIGTAIAVCVMELLIVTMCLFALRRTLDLRFIISVSGLPAAAAIIVAAAAYAGRGISELVTIPMAGALYLGLLWSTRRLSFLHRFCQPGNKDDQRGAGERVA